MESFYRLLLFFISLTCVFSQRFEEESPFLKIRWLDLEVDQWKPEMLDQLEQEIDDELKYADERKGIECQSINFEQEPGYPKEEDIRFLATSIRGFCRDHRGVDHPIPKEIITVAMERRIEEVSKVIGAKVYSIGNIQIYQRGQNLWNLIIIPISVGVIILLVVLTCVLRFLKDKQKRRHIMEQLAKKSEVNSKKATTVPNTDPNANENQRLLQLDPNVVGSASNTLGSPKEFTNEPQTKPTRKNAARQQDEITPVIQTRDNRFPYDPQDSEMIPMQEQAPRVVVRTIRDDGNPSNYHSQPYPDPPATRFVPIPVQIERSAPDQRFVPPPYHSDPYYRYNNA